MKLRLITFSLFLFINTIIAQQQTTTEVQDSFKTPQYEVVYDDIFLSKKETKWLLKVDFLPLLNALNEFVAGRQGLGLEFERKIGKHFSLNTGLFADNNIFDSDFSHTVALLVEPRYYFKNNSKNLNGEFISLRAELAKNLLMRHENYFSTVDLSLNVGTQRRLYNNWYANFQGGISYIKRNNPVSREWGYGETEKIGFRSDFTIGLAFGGGKKSTIQSCDVFKCFEEEKSLFKIDMRGLLIDVNGKNIYAQPIIAYERKLNESWSINQDLRFYIYKYFEVPNLRNDFRVTYNIEPRYYYNMKKRIAQGKSANNLSGNYFSLATGYNYRFMKSGGIINTKDVNIRENTRHFIAFIPKYGIQRRIFNRGFVDISFAPFQFYSFKECSFQEYGEVGNTRTETGCSDWSFGTGVNVQPAFDFKIGFAF